MQTASNAAYIIFTFRVLCATDAVREQSSFTRFPAHVFNNRNVPATRRIKSHTYIIC